MKHFILVPALIGWAFTLVAQTNGKQDSAHLLQEVIVRAYEQNRQLKTTSGSINYIDKTQLERFNNTSLLPAINATPGVRMEERSPGSYRLNMRGSTLRAPFGVRNVKVYWNGIPFTDPSGNTYLNQLSYYNVQSVEVIKGPGSSLYGAGTGGVLLINSQPAEWKPGAEIGYIRGSYNLGNLNVQARLGTDDRRNILSYSRLSSDGYRDHTNMRRDVVTWETKLKLSDRQELQTSMLYGDLYYQTPGALTRSEYLNNPRAARPAAGAFPSADQAQAAIYQKTFLTGIGHKYQFNQHLQNSSVVYGAFSLIRNPTFRNYEKRTEPHFGGRTVFTWQDKFGPIGLKLLAGGEAQRGFFNTKTYKNRQGNPDTLQTDDDINNWLYSAFAQADLDLGSRLILSVGASFNKSSIDITRLSIPSSAPQKRTYGNEWAPRLALSLNVLPNTWMFVNVTKGFSPPTAQEVVPSTTVINTGLNAEHGRVIESGVKSSLFTNRLYVEVVYFEYRLEDAIVQRRDASNADYFVNAGSTDQEGLEMQAQYQLITTPNHFFTGLRIWGSYTTSKFRYRNFKQLGSDYSGNRLPSVAPNTLAAGLDINTKPGLYANITWYYSDRIALNDANTDYAAAYQLTGARIGWRKLFTKKLRADLFAGVDNLFDARYSLGNDINAAGGRYFNTAPGVNYFGGICIAYPIFAP